VKPHRHPTPFSLTTNAAFTGHKRVWLIEADFSFRRTAAVGTARKLLNRARLAVLAALTRQSLLGRRLGAQTVRVRFSSGTHHIGFSLPAKSLASTLRRL
jgi:hypothetical protein